MTDSRTSEEVLETLAVVQVPQWKPPAFLNAMMRALLRTPGLQRWMGKGLALLTFTGRRSGNSYTIPVSYHRQDDTVVVVTKRQRNWWRNFESRPEVELRLAGRRFSGRAEVVDGDSTSLGFLTEYLEKRPIDAKAYGVRIDADGKPDPDQVAALLPLIVLVRIAITPLG